MRTILILCLLLTGCPETPLDVKRVTFDFGCQHYPYNVELADADTYDLFHCRAVEDNSMYGAAVDCYNPIIYTTEDFPVTNRYDRILLGSGSRYGIRDKCKEVK